MNNFPAMTEEQRQELIKMAKALSSGVEGNLIANLAKVALAALTAQPDHYVFHHPAGKLLNHLASDECKGQEHVVAGYTAPPAPVLRVPDGWIKCSERMPELDTKVLLLFTQYDNHIEDGFIGDEGDDVGWYHYLYDGDALQSNTTHWMPLPSPPEDSNDQC